MGFKLFIGSVRNIDIIGVELEIDFMSGIGLSTSFPWNCIFHPIPKSQKGEMIHLTSGAARKVLHIGIVGVRFVRCVEVKTGKLSTIKQGNKTTRMVIQQFAGSLPSSSSTFQQMN